MKATACPICLDPFNPTEPFLEGHMTVGNWHLFDPNCIRSWINIRQNCPICRAELQLSNLIQVSNENYSWYMHAIKRAQLHIIWGAKKIVPVAALIGASVALYEAAPFAYSLLPYYLSGLCSGTKATLISSALFQKFLQQFRRESSTRINDRRLRKLVRINAIRTNLRSSIIAALTSKLNQKLLKQSTSLSSILPMLLNKARGLRATENINKIFALAVLSAAVQAYYTPVEELSTLMGMIAGALLVSRVAGSLGENIREEELIQIGPLATDFTSSRLVLGIINLTAAFVVGGIAAVKLGNYYANDRGIPTQVVSSLAGGIFGVFSSYVTELCIEIPLIYWNLRRANA